MAATNAELEGTPQQHARLLSQLTEQWRTALAAAMPLKQMGEFTTAIVGATKAVEAFRKILGLNGPPPNPNASGLSAGAGSPF